MKNGKMFSSAYLMMVVDRVNSSRNETQLITNKWRKTDYQVYSDKIKMYLAMPRILDSKSLINTQGRRKQFLTLFNSSESKTN